MDRQRVLVIRNSALGDVAMTLPVLYCVARQYPDTDFYLLTRPFFARIFVNRPDNLHIIEADYKGRYRGVAGLWRCVADMRRYRFCAVADLHNVLRSWIIDAAMRIQGIPVAMVDKKRASRKRGCRQEQAQPFIDRYAEVFARLGFPVRLDFKSVYAADKPLPPLPVSHPAVGIAPFARYATKTYPLEQMQKVVEALTKKGVQVWLFGARGKEQEILEGWEKLMPGSHSLAGKMQIEDEMAMMASMDAMVAMDSANHHLAAAAGIRVVSVWGGTTPACGFMAYGQTTADAMQAGLQCQPCSTAGTPSCPLGTMACMRLVKPEEIVKKLGFS